MRDFVTIVCNCEQTVLYIFNTLDFKNTNSPFSTFFTYSAIRDAYSLSHSLNFEFQSFMISMFNKKKTEKKTFPDVSVLNGHIVIN